VSSQARDTYAEAAAIVARIPRAQAASEMAAEFQSHVAAFEHLSEESRADVINGLERSLKRWWRFLSTGVMPDGSDFDPLREWARARAAEGVRLEDLLWSFGLAHQLGWQLLRSHARSDESEALLELAGLLAEYLDHISAVVTETYLAERELLVSEEERPTRRLLDRLSAEEPLDASDNEIAERLGVPVDCDFTPFAVVLPGRPQHRHAALAARLRQRGYKLAVTQSDRVVGVTWEPLAVDDLGEGHEVLLILGEATSRGELAAAREELDVLAEHGRRVGLLGRLRAEDHLLEILIGRSPRLAERLRARVLAPLADDDHRELAHTLQTLLHCRFDRTATSAALHVHRNTLAYRLGRIEEITGLDLSSARDLACAYLVLDLVDRPMQAAAARGPAAR
jgi:PucR C-terminal helix-turn-helix domain